MNMQPSISINIASVLALVFCVFMASRTAHAEVLYYPAGKHRLAKIKSSEDHFAIRGDGSGITVLYVPGGITLSGRDPRISGITLIGSGRGTGITLKNSYRALVEDVEIQGYELGLLSLCEYGHRQWLHTYRDLYVYEGPDGNKKTYNPNIRGVELIYKGDKTESGRWKKGGGFSNTHTFFGGRIVTPGTPLLIDGPTATNLYGTYVDMPLMPIRMTKRSAGLQLFGVYLDQSTIAKKKKMPVLILENPKLNRVKIFGQTGDLVKRKLIVDGEGKPLTSKQVFVSPGKY